MDFCTSLFWLIISSYRRPWVQGWCVVRLSRRDWKSGRDQKFWLHYYYGSFHFSCVHLLLETRNAQPPNAGFFPACCNHSPLSATNGGRVKRPKATRPQSAVSSSCTAQSSVKTWHPWCDSKNSPTPWSLSRGASRFPVWLHLSPFSPSRNACWISHWKIWLVVFWDPWLFFRREAISFHSVPKFFMSIII